MHLQNWVTFADMIEFDNYYSWFSAKELRYNIDIHEPLQAN